VQWLDELFDGLALGDDVHLIGLSYGGWIAAQYATSRPDRLESLVLLAPAATVADIDPEFLARSALCLIPHRFFTRGFMHWLFEDSVTDPVTRPLVDELADDIYLGLRCFKAKPLVRPTVLSDEQLRSMGPPTILLVGENEKLYRARAALQRLRTVAPRIETVLVPRAGHDLTIARAEMVNAIIHDFLDRSPP
jgi:pimeloyl-ACP methyl ester carboxylesterase